MSNTHVLPDTMHELMARDGDLLAPAILASTLVVPGSGLTLAAFSTWGYVRNGSPTRLVYVSQPAVPVTLAGSPGAYWLALMHDTHSAVSGWTRVPGSHYAWRANATQPADPSGGLVMASITVTGTNITAMDSSLNYPYTKIAFGGTMGQLAFDKNLTWNGSLLNVAGNAQVSGTSTLVGLLTTNTARLVTKLIVGTDFGTACKIQVKWDKTVEQGMVMSTAADGGGGATIMFLNQGGTQIGSITQAVSNVAYNTTSDARLKHDVTTLTGELALIQALRPVAFRWNADNAPGVGFLAQEVAAHVQGVITGEADAVDEAGGIIPQMIDYSKLVPFLTGAVKTLAAQVEALTARIAVLEDALGV